MQRDNIWRHDGEIYTRDIMGIYCRRMWSFIYYDCGRWKKAQILAPIAPQEKIIGCWKVRQKWNDEWDGKVRQKQEILHPFVVFAFSDGEKIDIIHLWNPKSDTHLHIIYQPGNPRRQYGGEEMKDQ